MLICLQSVVVVVVVVVIVVLGVLVVVVAPSAAGERRRAHCFSLFVLMCFVGVFGLVVCFAVFWCFSFLCVCLLVFFVFLFSRFLNIA